MNTAPVRKTKRSLILGRRATCSSSNIKSDSKKCASINFHSFYVDFSRLECFKHLNLNPITLHTLIQNIQVEPPVTRCENVMRCEHCKSNAITEFKEAYSCESCGMVQQVSRLVRTPLLCLVGRIPI